MQAPQLKRGLFGYTSKSVRLIIADRDARTSEQARATEAVVLGLRSGAEILKRQRAASATAPSRSTRVASRSALRSAETRLVWISRERWRTRRARGSS